MLSDLIVKIVCHFFIGLYQEKKNKKLNWMVYLSWWYITVYNELAASVKHICPISPFFA